MCENNSVKPCTSVRIMRTSNHDLPCPQYATPGAAAFDLRANTNEDVIIPPGKSIAVPTGFAFEIPEGFVGIVCARSGLAAKNSICLTNGIGVIDSDYRGEVKVLLTNLSECEFRVSHGMRIAQMMIMPFAAAMITEVQSLSETERGEGGFGSTGVK